MCGIAGTVGGRRAPGSDLLARALAVLGATGAGRRGPRERAPGGAPRRAGRPPPGAGGRGPGRSTRRAALGLVARLQRRGLQPRSAAREARGPRRTLRDGRGRRGARGPARRRGRGGPCPRGGLLRLRLPARARPGRSGSDATRAACVRWSSATRPGQAGSSPARSTGCVRCWGPGPDPTSRRSPTCCATAWCRARARRSRA